jgi:hypothetical protein
MSIVTTICTAPTHVTLSSTDIEKDNINIFTHVTPTIATGNMTSVTGTPHKGFNGQLS